MEGTAQTQGVTKGREQRYYVALGRGCDEILRCKDCQALVLTSDIRTRGCCVCGNKRMAEIVTLTEAERTQVDAMDFPYKAEFLAEFAASE